MNRNVSFWPVNGFEDAPLRKRLAHFRPWIEDHRVASPAGSGQETEYLRDLASQMVDSQEAEFRFVADSDMMKNVVRWSQNSTWPFELNPDENGPIRTSAEGLAPISHARIGLVIPTHAHPRAAIEAFAAMAATYPGFLRAVIVANGVSAEGLKLLRQAERESNSLLCVHELKENAGYGPGCNAGLADLLEDETLDFYGVMNDDVLPGTDCLYELVYSFRQLESMGHRPGAIGPVSNEINGGQRVEIGPFEDVHEMAAQAHNYWKGHRSSASQTLQLRGLLMLMSRACLEAVGGFDPRFGIGNFEDDDHNLRTRLAGFTIWIANGAFLFHHGSSTFRSMKVDYEANIRRNMESMLRKWKIEKLDDWLTLESAPDGVSICQDLTSHMLSGKTILINGEAVDLIHQASDIEFAAWVMNQPLVKSPEGRKTLIERIETAA